MKAEELWRQSGLPGIYQAWAFGQDADHLAELVKRGLKTATCSARIFYELEGEALPQAGNYSIVLDAKGQAVCIIQTTRVYCTAFGQVTKEHAFKEGEGDRTLEAWQRAHRAFFTEELERIGQTFDETLELVCEEFKTV